MELKKHYKDVAFVKADGDYEDRRVKVVISTEAVDRDGDSMSLKGIDTNYYKKNPVVLWNHNHAMPIAKAENLTIQKGQMIADAVFPEAGVSKTSDEIYGLIKAGVINTASIGFVPKDFDRQNDGVWKITESELMEFSFVSVPSNREAVVLQRAVDQKNAEQKNIQKEKASQEQRTREIELFNLQGDKS